MKDPINPSHYKRGPVIQTRGAIHELEAIEVIRHIRDARLANAMKYVWRVGFGGKEDDRADIAKAIWYLQDWLDHPISIDSEIARRERLEGQ